VILQECGDTQTNAHEDIVRLERFTEKWNPVFGYEARQNNELEHASVSVKR